MARTIIDNYVVAARMMYDHVMAIIVVNHAVIVIHHVPIVINDSVVEHDVVTAVNVYVPSRLDHVRWVADDDVALRNINILPRNVHRIGHGDRLRGHYWLRGHYRLGSRRDGQRHLVEQRFPMPEAVEVQARQAAPTAFEDEELLRVVIAPDLTASDLGSALVDDAELVAILHDGRVVDLHFYVQVLLRPCFRRRGRSGMGLIEPRYRLMMPGRK